MRKMYNVESPPATLCQPAMLRIALQAGVALRAGIKPKKIKINQPT